MLLGYNDDFHVASPEWFERAAARKAEAVRWAVDWSGIQTKRGGPFDWTGPDHVYKQGRARRMRLVPHLTNSPRWARPSNRGPAIAPPDPAFDEAWEAFVKAFCLRYSPGIVEIWNEPNIESFWGGPSNPARMAALFNKAYATIRRNNPTHDALVLSPGLAVVGSNPSAQAEYFSKFKKNVTAGADYGAAVHLYAFRRCEQRGHVELCLEQLDHFRAAIDRRRLWVTEIGFPSSRAGQTGCTQGRQAEAHSSAWAGCRSRGVEAYIVHRLVDSGVEGGDLLRKFRRPLARARRQAGLRGPPRPAPLTGCLFGRLADETCRTAWVVSFHGNPGCLLPCRRRLGARRGFPRFRVSR